MKSRLETLFRKVLNKPLLSLTEQMGMEDIPGWDSIAHVNLCLAIEEEFGLELSVKEMAGITSVPAILNLLRQRGLG